MKNFNKLILSALVVSVVATSCSIEKRLHNPGYHVAYKNNGKTSGEEVAKKEAKEHKAEVLAFETKEVVAAASEAPVAVQVESSKAPVQTVSQPEMIVSKSAKANASVKNTETRSSVHAEKGSKKQVIAAAKKMNKKAESKSSGDDELILLYILCILIPFVAVGIVTDWELKPVLINILLSILCWIPGVIHAFITVSKNR